MAKNSKVQLVIDGKDNTKNAFESVDKGLLGISKSAVKAGAAIAGAFAVVAAGAVAKLVKKSIDAADNMRKLAQGAGVTTEALSGMSWAASQSGIGLESLATAMSRLNQGAAESVSGTGRYAEAFGALGMSALNAEGALKTADELLLEIADRFEAMPDGAQKSAFAIDLFGRSGAKLIPLLNAGSAGIAELTAQAERLGLVISDEQAAKSEEFNDNIASLGAIASGTGNILANEMLPVMNEMSGLLLDFAEDGDTAREAAASLSVVIKALAIGAVFVGAAFKATGSMIGAVGAAAFASATGDFAGAAFILKEGFSDYVNTTKEAMTRINTILDGGYNTQNKISSDQQREEKKRLSAVQIMHAHHANEVKSTRDQLLKDAESHIKDLVKMEQKAASDIATAKQAQLDTEKRYKIALAELRSGGAGDGTYSDASALKAKSRQQLQSGDIDGAKESAQAALEILRKIKAEGGNTYGFEGFAEELLSIERAADQIKLDGAQAELEKVQQNMEQIKLEAEQLKNMPVSVQLDDASLEDAKARIQKFADSIGRDVSIPVRVVTASAGPDELPAFASGGRVRGAGTGTSDSILARLSNGEYVMRAAAVRQYGTNLLDNMNGLKLPKFADGGAVGRVANMEPAGAKSIGTLNFNLPGGDSFSVDVAGTSSLDDLHRAALKFGRTRN